MSAKITLSGLANKFIANNPSLKVGIDAALQDISDSPFVDDDTKFFYPIPPVVISLYVKNNLWVLYHLNDACTEVDIWNIGKQGERVKFR